MPWTLARLVVVALCSIVFLFSAWFLFSEHIAHSFEGHGEGMAAWIFGMFVVAPLALISLLLAIFWARERFSIFLSLIAIFSLLAIPMIDHCLGSWGYDPKDYQYLVNKPFDGELSKKLIARGRGFHGVTGESRFEGEVHVFNGMKIYVNKENIITKVAPDRR